MVGGPEGELQSATGKTPFSDPLEGRASQYLTFLCLSRTLKVLSWDCTSWWMSTPRLATN